MTTMSLDCLTTATRFGWLPVSLPALAKLELEAALAVEDLDAVVVGVGDNDVVLHVDRHSDVSDKLQKLLQDKC